MKGKRCSSYGVLKVQGVYRVPRNPLEWILDLKYVMKMCFQGLKTLKTSVMRPKRPLHYRVHLGAVGRIGTLRAAQLSAGSADCHSLDYNRTDSYSIDIKFNYICFLLLSPRVTELFAIIRY